MRLFCLMQCVFMISFQMKVVQNVKTNPFVDIKIHQEKKQSVFAKKPPRVIIVKLIYVQNVKMEDFVISRMQQMKFDAFARFHSTESFVKVVTC